MLGLKKNAARSCFGWVLAWALVCLWAESTYATETRVLVLESQAPSGGLLPALQIQLSGIAAPERLAVPAAPGAAESIERGSRLVRERGALAAVWVEHTHAPGPVVLYVVGEREGRALVEVIRVPGGRGPELDRTIALKVREFVAAMQRGQAARPEAAQLLQPPPAPSRQPSAAEPELVANDSEAPPEAARNGEDAAAPAPSTPTWTTLLGVGARLGSQPEVGLGRWGLGVLAGPALELNGLRFAALLAFDVFPSVEVERNRDLVRYWEWAFGAVLHAQARVGTLWLGARAGTQLVGLDAYGLTRGARDGSSDVTAWTLLTAVDAEIPLTLHVSLAASLQLQALAKRLYLDVNDVSLVDLGRVRARIGLDLLARF